MQPQGTGLVNVEAIDRLVEDINKVDACAALQNLTNQVMATLQAEIRGIEAQLAALAPLIVIPTNLGSVISWATAQANLYLKPYQAYAAQLEQTLGAMARLAGAITAAADRLTHCTIVVPSVTVAGVSTPVIAASVHA